MPRLTLPTVSLRDRHALSVESGPDNVGRIIENTPHERRTVEILRDRCNGVPDPRPLLVDRTLLPAAATPKPVTQSTWLSGPPFFIVSQPGSRWLHERMQT